MRSSRTATSVATARHDAEQQAQDLGQRFQWAGRAGWLAKGVVYVLVGILAVGIARGDAGGGQEASNGGAIASLAEQSYGRALVVLVGIGLVLYAIWRLFTAVLPGDWTGRALLERIGNFISAVVYASLALTVSQVARSSGGSGAAGDREDRMVSDWVGELMQRPAGRWLVGAAGVVVAAVAVAFLQRAVTRKFEEDLAFGGATPTRRSAIVRLGQAGFAGRALSFALIALFLVRAAVTFDASEVGGIDGSLRQFTEFPWGRAVVALVAAGFVAYGLFCVLSASYQRLRGPRNG